MNRRTRLPENVISSIECAEEAKIERDQKGKYRIALRNGHSKKRFASSDGWIEVEEVAYERSNTAKNTLKRHNPAIEFAKAKVRPKHIGLLPDEDLSVDEKLRLSLNPLKGKK